jgi:hypothetical protein
MRSNKGALRQKSPEIQAATISSRAAMGWAKRREATQIAVSQTDLVPSRLASRTDDSLQIVRGEEFGRRDGLGEHAQETAGFG